MKSQKNRTRSVKITDQGNMSVFIRKTNEDHDRLIATGFKLTTASRLWFKKNERFTLRLVYRKDKASTEFEFTKISHVFRG